MRPAPTTTDPNPAVPPAHHVGVLTDNQEGAPPSPVQDGQEHTRLITVTPARVRQAASKHNLGHLLADIPADRLAGFLGELGVVVKSDPVPDAL